MEMDIEVQRAAKTLDESDRPRACAADTLPAGAQTVSGKDGAQGEVERPSDQLRVAREEESRPARQRKDPLARRDAREDAVDQVSGRPLHPPRRARWANSAALTRECDERLVATRGAAHAGEAVDENATAQIALELRDDEPRQAAAVIASFRLGEEGVQVLADGLVQEGLLRLAAAVALDGPERPLGLSGSTAREAGCSSAVHGAGAASRTGPTRFSQRNIDDRRAEVKRIEPIAGPKWTCRPNSGPRVGRCSELRPAHQRLLRCSKRPATALPPRDDLNHTSDWHIDAGLDRLARIGAFRHEVGGGRR
jgi:hypothetical protein